jgi:hypothetical protein
MNDVKARYALPRRLARFDREFYSAKQDFTYLGMGALGGKAQGLAFIRDTLGTRLNPEEFPGITVQIPRLTVLTTGVFDSFMERNKLHDIACSEATDEQIARAFQSASFPEEFVGDLLALIGSMHTPLAVRSSSLLEDAIYRPFAGVYATKMIPNNQLDRDSRFHRLIEAIKCVYASTFTKKAKSYLAAAGQKLGSEKMAVILQEVVGRRYRDKFYPDISGVARSHNFYPTGNARHEDGVVQLALGLGKTVVDGGTCWSYSPAYPDAAPPFGSATDMLRQTQTEFWTVNMGRPPAYDPMKETEYLKLLNVSDAEEDATLDNLVSTYDAASDRVLPGARGAGAKVLNFAPILVYDKVPLNHLLASLLKVCEEAVGSHVEIEFAATLDPQRGVPVKFGFLQVRPTVVTAEEVEVSPESMTGRNVLAASESVMGNGTVEIICDIVYVKPEAFQAKHTRLIAEQLTAFNAELVEQQRPYLLIGFGRWGSSDPWLGIPISWSHVSGAKALVEATLPHMNVELSQGSHFFHNLSSFRVGYFAVRHDGKHQIDWPWLDHQQTITETEFVRHVRLTQPLSVRMDGRTGRGVILHDG